MSHPRALILIDVQEGFLNEYTRRCLPRIHELVAQDFDLVIATKFSNPPDSPFRRLIHWDRLSGPPETDLDPVVEAAADAVVGKTTYGVGEDLMGLLDEAGISHVVMAGVDTDVCVLQNAAYLFDHGVVVSVDVDGCATNGGPAADAAARALLVRTLGAEQVIGGATAL